MKKSSLFIIPIVLFAAFGIFGGRLLTSGVIKPSTMAIIAVGAFILMLIVRPKKQVAAPTPDTALSILGDFAKDAFIRDEKLASRFTSAVADYVNGMPKSALSKLEKLQPLCETDNDTYAVSVVLGLSKCQVGDFETAIKLYNKAVILSPSTELAMAIGSCHQRIGELDQAIDSYEFALDLDPQNIAARSAIATACVGDGRFEEGIDQALLALKIDENNASALATCAICYGVLNDPLLCKSYTEKAVANGYKEEKINSTIPALKKKFKR